MFKNFLIGIILFAGTMLSGNAYSQKDSLLNSVRNLSDTAQFRVINKFFWTNINSDPVYGKQLADELLRIAGRIGEDNHLGKALRARGVIFIQEGDNYRAEAMLDSALVYTVQAGNQLEEANCYNNLGVVYRGLGERKKAEASFLRAADYFEKGGHSIRLMTIKNNLSAFYSTLGNFPKALEFAIEALETAERDSLHFAKGNIYNTIGTIYLQLKKSDKALSYFRLAIEYYKKEGNKTGQAVTLGNIGRIYFRRDEYEKSLAMHDTSLMLAKELDHKMLIALNKTSLGNVYNKQSHYRKAIENYKFAVEIGEEFGGSDTYINALIGLAEANLKLNNLSEAQKYADKAKLQSEMLGLSYQKKNSYKTLVEIHQAKKEYKKALEYSQLKEAESDSIHAMEKDKLTMELEARYESEKLEQEIELQKRELELAIRELDLSNETNEALQAGNDWKTAVIYLSFLGFLMLGIVFFLVVNRQRQKFLKKREIMEKNKLIYEAEQALARAKMKNTELEQQKLTDELEFKKRELELKKKEVTSYTLSIIQKNKTLEELKENLKTIINSPESARQSQLRRLYKLVDHSFNLDRDWEDFKVVFESVHRDFFVTLKKRYPNLTNGELRLCALLKLDMNTKQMANLLNISPQSVNVARYRLRKSLQLPKEENLSQFLSMINES